MTFSIYLNRRVYVMGAFSDVTAKLVKIRVHIFSSTTEPVLHWFIYLLLCMSTGVSHGLLASHGFSLDMKYCSTCHCCTVTSIIRDSD